MKKAILLGCVLAAVVTSCTTTKKTASTGSVTTVMASAVITDLDVSNQKISYTYRPTWSVRRGGKPNCIRAAINEALEANGGGDVLVETQEAVVSRTVLRWIKTVTVTGYPAKYKNYRPADDATVNAGIVNGILVTPGYNVKKK
ncbi:MAG: hypothetical protein LUI09_05510 [Prevotellaceae bacterium]|nr:hypothetical protein [Prevotellaceae bacterium]